MHAYPHRARIICVGSILEHLSEQYSGVVLGSGFTDQKSRMKLANASIVCVRGKLTRESIDRKLPEIAYGDPG